MRQQTYGCSYFQSMEKTIRWYGKFLNIEMETMEIEMNFAVQLDLILMKIQFIRVM